MALTAEPTKYAAGAIIWGDYWDLRSLHETIHSIESKSQIPEGLGDFLLGLAYDLRHAYQGMRDSKSFGFEDLDKVNYSGARVLWPVLLFQVGLLRALAAYVIVTKEDQANLYRLEHIVEAALLQVDQAVGRQCIDWLQHFRRVSNDYLPLFISEMSYQFLFEAKPGKSRFKKLPAILCALSESSQEYRAFKAHIEQKATEAGVHVQELADWGEWPEFKW